MINSVSSVSFKSNNQDLINSEGKFSTNVPAQTSEVPADSFEKSSSHKGVKIGAGVALAALAGFIGLGYAVKSGKLQKASEMPEGFMKKAWTKVKDFGATIGEYGKTCIEKVEKLFGKKASGKAAEDAAETAAETVAK